MAFDLCEHTLKLLTIRAGQEILSLKREIDKLRGLPDVPEEKNITKIYDETCRILGINPIVSTSSGANKLPAPHETRDKEGKLVIPKKDCPKCKLPEKMSLLSICSSCADSEGGQYHTMWKCEHCGVKLKSKKFMIQWLNELGIDYKNTSKGEQGIKTVTDDGIK